VIHTVGPVWRGGGAGEADQLASCYRRCLERAEAQHLRSLAFPCISTGVYGYPLEAAARVAVTAVRERIASGCTLEEVIFCCFAADDLAIYLSLIHP
jgi:O-acetyl-ADP-ribose deacetylase (regulator of RNase III)